MPDILRLANAQIRYYYRLSPAELAALSDHEWAVCFTDLRWIREQEAKAQAGEPHY